jgi:hypothetical protein
LDGILDRVEFWIDAVERFGDDMTFPRMIWGSSSAEPLSTTDYFEYTTSDAASKQTVIDSAAVLI